jgi:hypothetical protein
MTGQGRSHGWAWECIGPPTWEPGPANQNEKRPDVEVLGCYVYTQSVVVRPGGSALGSLYGPESHSCKPVWM